MRAAVLRRCGDTMRILAVPNATQWCSGARRGTGHFQLVAQGNIREKELRSARK